MSKKITELTALSAPAATDLAVVVDMSGTPTTKKSTLAQLSTAITIAISQVTGLAADLATRALASVTLTAGGGLTGGGDLSANRTFAVGAGTGITVNADDIAVNYGTTSTTACVGNDSRLSDARTPTAHASSHQSGGGDAIKLDDLAAPDDNTDLDASTSKHGLVVKATAPASGLLSAIGIGNGETAYTMKPLFDTTNPAALGTAGPGTQVIAARRDHIHALPVWTEISNTDTGAQNNWAPSGLSWNTLIEWNGASGITLTGLAGGSTGQLVTIKNITAAKVATFAHASGSSSAANRFTNLVTSAPTPVASGGYITYQHDGTNWVLVGHLQGAPVTSTFSAGDFVASGGGTWTVESGDVESIGHIIEGRKLTVFISINTTTWAAAGNRLNINQAAWGGFTIDATARNTIIGYMFDAANVITQMFTEVGNTAIAITRFDNANLTAGTNVLYMRGIYQAMVT